MKAFYLLIAFVAVHSAFGQQLPDDVDLSNIPEVDEDQLKKAAEEGKKALKEKCLEVSGTEDTFVEVEGAKDTLMECVQGIVNITAVQTELDEAKKRGAMEEVFGKYCKKKPELMECVTGFRTTLEKCMIDKEKDQMKSAMNLTESLLDFVCYKDGDRVAMFIAEGGFECIDSKKNEVQACVNATFTEMAPKSVDLKNIGDFMIIDETKCDNFNKLQKCVVEKLEGCNNQTPANVVDALFKYIKKSLPCSTPPETGAAVQLVEYNRLKRQAMGYGFEMKCQKNSLNPYAYQELTDKFGNFWNCTYSNLFRGNPDKCPTITRNVEICAEEFYPKLRQCLVEKEDKFFMGFVSGAVKAVLEYACGDNGKNLRDFMQVEGLKCLNNSESSHNFKACLQRADRHKTEDGQVIFEKESLCKDVDNIRMCSVKHITASKCGQHKRFVELVDGFLESIYSPCSTASSVFVNLTLLITVLCYHFKKYFD